MGRLIPLHELEEQIDGQNEQDEDHKRESLHDCSFDPRTSIIDLVALIGFLVSLLRAKEPLLSSLSRK